MPGCRYMIRLQGTAWKFCNRRQGPGEATTANMCYYNAREKKISVYDESSMKLLTYRFDKDADNWGALIEERSFYDLGGTVRRVWELRNGRFLVGGQLGTKSDQQKRFQMLADAKVVADYNDFPIDTPKNVPFGHRQQLRYLRIVKRWP